MRFGIASKDITPPYRMKMYGYGDRQDVFDAVHDPLTFTAVVLEEDGRRALLGAADLGTMPNDGTVLDLARQIGEAIGCPAGNVMLNASHTHGGPQLPSRSPSSSPISRYSDRYRDFLYEQAVATAREAAAALRDGTLWYAEGKTTLPMNRRIERDGVVVNAPNPKGPVDNRMQLLILRDADGQLASVGMKVACHPVATGSQHLVTAEYPGAWRAAFKRVFGPTVHPFFLQGAGADARPRHVANGDQWRAMQHAELATIGDDLLTEMLATITSAHQRPVTSLTLTGTVNHVQAPCERRYTTRADLDALRQSGQSQGYVEASLKLLDAGGEIPDHVEFYVQTLWLSRDLALIGLNVEPLCGLGRLVEAAIAPQQAMLLGYTNGCLGYTADALEMKRGGYEASSHPFGGCTGPLLPGLEDLFAGAVQPHP
jgi:hypothetical protein